MADTIRVEIAGDSGDLQAAVAEAIVAIKTLQHEVRAADRGGLRRIGDDADATDVKITGLAANIRAFRTVAITSLIALAPAAAAGLSSLGAGAVEFTAGLAPVIGLLAVLPAGLAGAIGGLGTLAIGFHGVTDAIKGNQKAYEQLSPAAKGFVTTLHDDFLPGLKDIQATAQRKMFPGFLEALHELQGALPTVERVVGRFAATLGHVAERSANFLVDPRHLREIEALFNQGDQLVQDFFRAGFNWGDAFLQIAIAARPLTDALSKDLVGISRDFDHLITEARRNGDLQRFFKATLDVTETLFSTLGHLGGAFIDIGKIAFPFGDRMLHGLQDITERFDHWTSSAAGKNAIAGFFADAQPPLHELGLLVVALGQSLGKLVEEGLVPLADLAHVARVDLLPLIDELGVLLGEILPPLIDTLSHVLRLGGDVAPALQLLVGPLRGVLVVINDLADALDALSKINPALGAVGTGAAIAAGALVVGKLAKAWDAVKAAATGAKVAELAAGDAAVVAGAETGAAGVVGGAAAGIGAGRGVAATGIAKDIQVLGGGEAVAAGGVGAAFLAKIKSFGPALRVIGRTALWADLALGILAGIQQKGGAVDKIDEALHSFTLGLAPGAGDRFSEDLTKRLKAQAAAPGLIRNLGNVAGSLNPFGGNFLHPAEEQDRARKLLDILKQIPGADEQHLRALRAQADKLADQLNLTDQEKTKIGELVDQQNAALAQQLHQAEQLKGKFVGFGIANAIAKDHQLTKGELRRMIATLSTLPPAARKTASDTILEMTKRLVAQGDLPVSAFRRIMHALRTEADRGGVQLNTSLASSFASMLGMVSASSAGLFPPLNAALKALGVKPVKFNAKSFATTALGIGTGLVTAIGSQGKARGGYLDGTPDLRDKTPVLAAKDEAFLTRHQQRPIQAALARDKARGDGAYGSLEEVFGSVTKPHNMAQGGFAGPFGSGAGFVPVTNLARETFGLGPTAGRTNHSELTARGTRSEHADGRAVDYSNSPPNETPEEDAFAGFWKKQLPQVISQLIYRDRILAGRGAGAAVPGHEDHVHLGLLPKFAFDAKTMGKLIAGAEKGKGGNIGALLKGIGGGGITEQIAKLTVGGPDGALKALAQGALDKLAGAANALLSSQAGAAGGGDSFAGFKGPWVSVEHQIADAKKWSVPDWNWVIGHESGGKPNEKNPTSTAFGLGQLLDSTSAKYGGGPGSSAVDQIKAMARYIADRYGNPTKAKAFWQAHNYYARGGFVGSVQDSLNAVEQSFDAGGTVTAARKPPAKNPFAPADKPKTKTKAQTKAETEKHKAELEAKRKKAHEKSVKAHRAGNRQRVERIIKQIRHQPFHSGLPILDQIKAIQDKRLPGVQDYFNRADHVNSRLNLPDELLAREDIALPSRAGHQILDTGKEEVADLSVAATKLEKLDKVIRFAAELKALMDYLAERVREAVRQATKAIVERQKRVVSLKKMRTLVEHIHEEKAKKKPDGHKVGRWQGELEDLGHDVGIPAAQLRGDQGFRKVLSVRLKTETEREDTRRQKLEQDLSGGGYDLKTTLVDLVGTGGHGGRRADLTEQLGDLTQDRAQFTPAGLRARLDDLPVSSAQSSNQSELADLIRQQNVLLARGQQLAALNAPVLPGLVKELPFLGGFAMGTLRVPREGLAHLHRDEMIVPDPQGPHGSQLRAPVAGGDQPVEITLVLADRSGAFVELVDARVAKHTPVIIKQADRAIGARARQLAYSPGRS